MLISDTASGPCRLIPESEKRPLWPMYSQVQAPAWRGSSIEVEHTEVSRVGSVSRHYDLLPDMYVGFDYFTEQRVHLEALWLTAHGWWTVIPAPAQSGFLRAPHLT